MANDKPTGISQGEIANAKELENILNNISKSTEERRKNAEATLDALQKQLELSRQEPDGLREQLDLEKQVIDQYARMRELSLQAKIDERNAAYDHHVKTMAELDEQRSILEDIIADEKESLEDKKLAEKEIGKINKALVDQDKHQQGILDKLDKEIRKRKQAADAAEQGKKETTVAMVAAMDKQGAETAKLTGRGRQYSQTIFESSEVNRSFGIGLGETGDAFRALYSSMAAFSDLDKKTQKSLTVTTSKLAALGISAADQAENMNMLTKGLGMIPTEAMNVQMEIADLASKLGEPVAKLAAGFKASMQTLQVYGARGVKIFKKLAAQAKGLGIDVAKLTSTFGSSMDTFEGSADVAGKLNTILGKDMVSSVRLLYATEAERVDMIRQSVAASGKSWQSMTKFQKLAVMNAAGIKDMSMANKLFGTSLEVYELQKIKAEEAAASQERMNKALLPAKTFTQRLTAAMQHFGVAVMPIIKIMTGIVEVLIDVFKTIGVGLKVLEYFGTQIHKFGMSLAKTAGIAISLKHVLMGIGIVFVLFAGKAIIITAAVIGLIALLKHWWDTTETGKTVLGGIGKLLVWTTKFAFMPLYGAIIMVVKAWGLMKKVASGIAGFFGFGKKVKEGNKALKEQSKILRERKSPALYQMPEVMAEGYERMGKKADVAAVKTKKVVDSTKKITDATGRKKETILEQYALAPIRAAQAIGATIQAMVTGTPAGAGATADVKRNIVITFNPDRDAPAFKEAVLHVINTHKR